MFINMSIPMSIIYGQFSINVFQRRDIKIENGISSSNFKKQYMDKKIIVKYYILCMVVRESGKLDPSLMSSLYGQIT